MKKILIGEDHNNSFARELILKLITKLGNSKIHLMIEFEPSDYQKFVQDAMVNKVKEPSFQPLVELIKTTRSKGNITIVPIDISWKILLEGIQDKIKNQKATTADILLNELLEKSWEDVYSIKNAVASFIPNIKENKAFKSLSDLLGSMKVDEIFSKLSGEIREEFYKKRSMQILRDKYFIEKIKMGGQANPEFLIILVGNNHFPALEMAIKTDNNHYLINLPENKNIDNFIEVILSSKTPEKQAAPSNSAPNSSFHQAQSNDQPSSLKPPDISTTLSHASPQPKP